MIVVQRRSDGKFWRNTTGRGYWYPKLDKDWVTDLQDVKPYRNVAAAKRFFSVGFVPWGREKHVDACCAAVRWSRNGMKNKCEHYLALEAEQLKNFHDTYLLVEVNLTIKGEVA